jgi:hypothetical protein
MPYVMMTCANRPSDTAGIGVGIVGNRIFKFNLSRPEGTIDNLAGYWGGSHLNYGNADGIGASAHFYLVQFGIGSNSDGDLAVTAKEMLSSSQTHGTTV